MNVDFFTAPCKSSTESDRFGLCDDPPPSNAPAYIDEKDDSIWIAEVQNPKNLNVTFIAVDNCIDIKRTDGSQESRCDGMLLYESKLIFVELKDRNSSGWAAKATEQLTITYNVFMSNHDLTVYSVIEGFICNKQRPLFNSSYANVINKFNNDTKLKLNIQRIIKL